MEDAEACGLFETDTPQIDVHPSMGYLDGVVGVGIPYFNADGSPLIVDGIPYVRMRRLGDIPKDPFTGNSAPKYVQGKGTGIHVYLCPLLDWEAVLADPAQSIVITEGEAKAIALCSQGVPCIALGGVSSIRDTDTKEFMPETRGAKWAKRIVLICFDSDQLINPNVKFALEVLRAEFSIKLHADVRIVTLPMKPGGFDKDGSALPDEKLGIDDFIQWQGFQAFAKLLAEALPAGVLEKEVLAINQDCALIQEDEAIYHFPSDSFMSTTWFKDGSEYSVRRLKQVGMSKKGPVDKPDIEVAKEWVHHPNSQRYSKLVFMPGKDRFVEEDGVVYLNRWKGIAHKPGNVQPFLDLSAFIFSGLKEEHRDFAMKLLAYKAQNPGEKIPIAIFLVGLKGSGKGMWCSMVEKAFGPYSKAIPANALNSDFNAGWMDKNLIVRIDEVTEELMKTNGAQLKTLVADDKTFSNEKFRKAKEIPNIVFFLFTTNENKAAAFDESERRYFVVNVPDRLEGAEGEAFYIDYLKPFIGDPASGPAIMDYLLNYDLQGWRPPMTAPMTAEREIAMAEGLSAIGALAKQMKTSDENTIRMWVESSYYEAESLVKNPPSNLPASALKRALATMHAMPKFPIRPLYSMSELGWLFGSLTEAINGNTAAKYKNYSPQQISGGLRENGIKFLRNLDNEAGFLYNNKREPWLIVSDIDNPSWKKGLTQAEFDIEVQTYNTYNQFPGAKIAPLPEKF